MGELTAVKMKETKPVLSPKPFLKWAGGKRQLLGEIRQHVPKKFGNYFEPFLGGGALFFSLSPSFAGALPSKTAFLGDANEELITTYTAVRGRVSEVVKGLRAFEKMYRAAPILKREQLFYELRDERIPRSAGVRRAVRMIALNKTCFNGLYRVNKKGGFNVPFGRFANPTICDEENLRQCSRALSRATLDPTDFASTVSIAKRGDLVYFDPPYIPASSSADFTSYTKGGFGPEEQERLRDLAVRLKNKGVIVLLSNSDVPDVWRLYQKSFSIRKVQAIRAINSKADKRGAVGELLIW